MANIGTIIGGGFRVIKEQPAAVAVWAGVYAVLSIGSQLVMHRALGGAMVDPEAIRSGAVSPFGMMISAAPIWIVTAIVYAVLTCAVYRAVLRPSERSFASLRLGMDELRFIGISLLLIVAFIIVGVIVALLFGVVMGGVFAATGGGATSGVLAFVVWLVCVCGIIYFWIRLSLIFPLSFARRAIVIDDAWRLTRGNFWTLFLAYLVIGIISFILTTILVGSAMAPYFAMLAQGLRNPEAMKQISEQIRQQQQDMPMSTMVLMGLLGAVVSTITLVLGSGAAATATRELLLDDGEVLEGDAETTAAIFE
jgi:hypothetical protein